MKRAFILTLAVVLMTTACGGIQIVVPGGDGGGGGGDTNGGNFFDDFFGGIFDGGNVTDDFNDFDDGDDSAAFMLTGRIDAATSSAKWVRHMQSTGEGFGVIAQSAESGMVYRAQADASGEFELPIPADELDHAMMVTIINPDGRAAGPVIFGEENAEGLTGFGLDDDIALGEIDVPDVASLRPITPGDDSNVFDKVSDAMVTRLDENGVPVGVLSIGKGDDSLGTPSDNPLQMCDIDMDGLIDLFDADNDGDGLIDDIDSEDPSTGMMAVSDARFNVFMNLKLAVQDSGTYYNGSQEDIEADLETRTVITFEVAAEQGATRAITAVRALNSPAPTYMNGMSVQTDNGSGLVKSSWADADFAFSETGDRMQAFVIPNALIEAGDAFTVEVEYDDGTTEQFTRMINYVWRNIPRLIEFGAVGSMMTFDPSMTTSFDATQDLVFKFQPPVDENGDILTGFAYHFEIFYNESGGGQLNQQIDTDATFTTDIEGFNAQNRTFEVTAAQLTLADDDTYTVTLPKEIFVTMVETSEGMKTVESYKIDIAAQSGNGDNSALMISLDAM